MSNTFGHRLQQAISDNTKGDYIDIMEIARTMACTLSHTLHTSTLIASLTYADGLRSPAIALNPSNTEAQSNTAVALLLAKHCFAREQNVARPSEIDVFYLREMRAYKTSRQVILATRLAIPEHIIEKSNDLRFYTPDYAQRAALLPALVDAAFHIPQGSGVLNLLDAIGDISRPSARNTMAKKALS